MQNKRIIVKVCFKTEESRKNDILAKLYEFLKDINIDYLDILEEDD